MKIYRSPLLQPMTTWLIAGLLITALCQAIFGQPTDSARPHLRTQPLSATDALNSFKLHGDFRIELVASEPLIEDPVAMAFDEQGTLFVVEHPEFNHYAIPPERRRRGRVKRLLDTDLDGRFDRATVFVEAPFATAVICYAGGVLVGAPPDILYCKDTDGDGVANVNRVVLTGFGRDFAGGGLLNSFRWGMDNFIHIATGFAGGLVRHPEQQQGAGIDIRSRGLLLDPRSMEFQPTSGGGQHGMSLDDWGNKFLCSNVYPLQMLVYDDRHIARNPYLAAPAAARNINGEDALAPLLRISPLEPWRVARSRLAAADQQNSENSRSGGVFTSASGITVYRGDAFADEFQGNLFVGEVANNLVYRARLEWRGIEPLALRADPDAEFLASHDSWFRPVQLSNGPDGALYVVDMYRELIEGAAFVPKGSLTQFDPSRGVDRGRIYRIVPRTFRRRSEHQFAGASAKELVGLLDHANGWHRDTAARLILEQDCFQAIGPLQRLARDSESPRSRLLALYNLASLRALEPSLLRSALDDADPRVRQHAIRLAESRLASSPSLSAALHACVSDPDIRVRYELAFTLGSAVDPRRNASLAALVRGDGDNPWMLMAVHSSLNSGAGEVLADIAAADATSTQPLVQRLIASLARQIGQQNDPAEVADALQSATALKARHPALSQSIQSELLGGMKAAQLARFRQAETVDQLVVELLEEAKSLAVDRRASPVRRHHAIRTLGIMEFGSPGIPEIFARLLQPDQPTSIQLVSCQVLARFNDPQVPLLLTDHWNRMTPQVRDRCLSTILSRPQWISALLDSVESGRLSRHDFDPERMHLFAAESPEKTRVRIERLFPQRDSSERTAMVASYRSSLQLEGDAAQGATLFNRLCANCHQRRGVGKELGPALDDTSRKSTDDLLVEILDPNRRLKPVFQNYVLRTADGRTLIGMIAEETANSVRLQQADGQTILMLRVHIESLQGTGVSFMPEGFEKTLSPQAMADLLAFLRS